MRLIPLQSGSAGNCLLVESDGVRLLIDAGVSGARVEARLAAHGIDIRSIDAVLVTHDHSDHISAAGILHRRFGLPLHLTAPTYHAVADRIGAVADVVHFTPGDTLLIGGLCVETIATPHDAVDGCVFVVDDGRARLGIFTDLGHCFDDLQVIETCDAVLLESNYDPDLLATGSYHPRLKARIAGPGGHLANHETAWLLERYGRNLRWACLAHLSAENNTAELALAAVRQAIGPELPLHVAERLEMSGTLTV